MSKTNAVRDPKQVSIGQFFRATASQAAAAGASSAAPPVPVPAVPFAVASASAAHAQAAAHRTALLRRQALNAIVSDLVSQSHDDELGALHALSFILYSKSLTNLRQIEELVMNTLWYGVADSSAQARLTSPFELCENRMLTPSAENGIDDKMASRDSYSFEFLELCNGNPFLMPAHLPLPSGVTCSTASASFAGENPKSSNAPPSHSAFAVSKSASGKVNSRVSEQDSARRISEAANEKFRKFSLQRRNLLRESPERTNEAVMAPVCVTASTVHFFSRALIAIRQRRDALVSRILRQNELNHIGTDAAASAHIGLFTQYLDSTEPAASPSSDSSACVEVLSVADISLARRSVIFWMDALCALAHQACSFQLEDRHRVFAVCAARSLAESLNLMQPKQIKQLISWCLRAIGASEFEFHADDRFFQDLAAFLIGSILKLLHSESVVSATTSTSSGHIAPAASLLCDNAPLLSKSSCHSGGALLLDALHAPHESRFRLVAAASALSSNTRGSAKEEADAAPEFSTLEAFLCMEAKLEAIRWRKLTSSVSGASERALHVLISAFTSQQMQHQHRLALDMLLALFYNDILRCSVPQCPLPAKTPDSQAPAPISDSTVSSSAHEAEFYVRDALAQWQRQQRPSMAESPTDLECEFAPAQSALWAGILLYSYVHIRLSSDTDFSRIWHDHGRHLQDEIKATIASPSNAGKSPEA